MPLKWHSRLSDHDKTALTIARRFRKQYNEGEGPDIETKSFIIEVETMDTIMEGVKKLNFIEKDVYLAGVDERTTKKIYKTVHGTAIGVMDQWGDIIEPSTRADSYKMLYSRIQN